MNGCDVHLEQVMEHSKDLVQCLRSDLHLVHGCLVHPHF